MTHLEIAFTLNGEQRRVRSAAHHTLLQVLRDDLGVVDAKEGCGEGVCGACTVLLDDEPVSSCLVLAPLADGRAITTVSGLGRGASLHGLQTSFVQHGAVQCGFCTPGMILTAYAFLRDHPAPTRGEIRRAIAGNLCRCTGYAKIVDAIAAAVRKEGGGA